MKIFVMRKKTFIICVLTLAFLLVSAFGATGVIISSTAKKRSLPIYSVKTDEKKVAISFDCAWGVDYTDKLLNIMRDKKVPSTFFMVEFWTNKYPEYVKKIDDFGHEIGTHSATHSYMSKQEKSVIIKELTTSSACIEKITGKKVSVFRPPYGDYNDRLIDTATELSLFTIQWDVDSLDWKNISATEIYERVTKKVKNGSIVLFHNNGLHTAEALPKIIDNLLASGYVFCKMSDLIYKDNYRIDTSGTQIKNN